MTRYFSRQSEIARQSGLRYNSRVMDTPDKKIRRRPENTILTISLTKSLKARIQEEAKKERRSASVWIAIKLEKELGMGRAMESGYGALHPLESSLVADEPSEFAGNGK